MSHDARILVVDDDFDLRDAIADGLQDAGYQVATAADGIDALGYLRANPSPRLILLDWMMPRCDGAQFRQMQLADPRMAAIPVVLLSADARIEEKTRQLQIAGFLAKPVDLERLLAVVARFCGGCPA